MGVTPLPWVLGVVSAAIHTTATCTIATIIERWGHMLTVKEFAPLLGESPRS